MGLRKESIALLMQEGRREPFRGKIATLGKQDVSIAYSDLVTLARRLNYPLRPVDKIESSEKNSAFISDRTLFSLLGFDEIISLDASKYENADIIYDLNQDTLPSAMQERFDMVLDPGTIEHVFHLPNCLKNIFNMLRIGGRVIHISPSSNHLDHGFYMFSPTLFRDYYLANHFALQSIRLIQHKPQLAFSWKFSDYSPEKFRPFSFGGLDSSMYAVYVIASKKENSRCDVIPQQHAYAQDLWIKKTPTITKWIHKSERLYAFCSRCFRICKKIQLRRLFNSSKSYL